MPRRPRQLIDDIEVRHLLERLSDGGPTRPSLDEQLALAQEARIRAPDSAQIVDRWLLYEIDELRQALELARENQAALKKVHQQLTSPPWHTAVFLRPIEGTPARAVVAYQHTPRVVAVAEEADIGSLSAGDDVLITHDLNMVVQKLTPSVSRACEVAEFQHALADGRLVLKAHESDVIARAAGALDITTLRCGDRVRWDSALALAFERLPRDVDSRLILTDTPTESFADIGGLDQQIERLQRAVHLHRKYPDLVARYGLRRSSSVLLVGPPGTGKTMLARALAQWLGEQSPDGRARFLYIKPATLHSMWWGQSEANYREVFQVAREAGAAEPAVPVVLFFDEVDSIGATRNTHAAQRVDDRVLTSFMTELDGLQAKGNVFVVAATNRRDALDPALLRPGRLGDIVLDVPRPTMAAARAILERHFLPSATYELATEPSNSRCAVIDTALSRLYAPNGGVDIATITFRDGTRRPIQARDLVSGAMLANIARMATERACIRELEAGDPGIRRSDVLDAIIDELANAVAALTPGNCHTHIAGLPQDLSIVRVEVMVNRPRRPHRFLTVA